MPLAKVAIGEQMSDLTLTIEEQAMLDGADGPGVQRAMEIVVTLARIYGAADLVPVSTRADRGCELQESGRRRGSIPQRMG